MTEGKLARGRSYADILGKEAALSIVDTAGKRTRARFDEIRAKIEKGDDPVKYTRRQNGGIAKMFRALAAEHDLDVAVLLDGMYKLAARVAELEAKPDLKYLGVFEQGKAYREGSAITDHGSLWIARSDTVIRPGENADWQLAVKKGKDAR